MAKDSPRTYRLLTQEQQDEMLAATLAAQEADHFIHTINLERYEAILGTIDKEHPFHARVSQLHAETVSRLVEVNSIIDALEPQLPDDDRLGAAMARIDAKSQPAQ